LISLISIGHRTPLYRYSQYDHKISRRLKSLLRGYYRVCAGSKTVALAHQYQREKDDYGRIVAEMPDYAIAYQLIKDAFLEGLGQKNYYTDKRLQLISKVGKMTAKRVAEITGVSVAAIFQWLNPQISKGVLTWCDEDGVKFADKDSLEKAKRSGNAYVRINGTLGLPSPFDMSGDERWSPGGALFREYDLGLEDADDQGSLNDAVVEVDPPIDNDRDRIIDFSKMHQAFGVKVLRENNGSQNKNISDNGGGSAIYSEISAERHADEISGILSFK
jgi:hypothetical protein